METNAKLRTALSETELDAKIELWDVDLRAHGGGLMRFCNQQNALGGNIVWQGNTYQAYPIEGQGFKLTAQGASARPTLRVSNLMGLVTAAVSGENLLLGGKVARRQTLARFLDAINFDGGNPQADPQQETVQWFVIERISSLTAEAAGLELAVPSEADGSILPRRIIIAGLCAWRYRSAECGYTGGPVADALDRRTGDRSKDQCSGTLTGCRLRHHGALPFGGFPGVDKVR